MFPYAEKYYPISFPGSSAGKESAKMQETLVRFLGWALQYSCASLVAQTVKNPAMQEAWVRSLGWEDPLEKEMATLSSILAWRIPWTQEPGRLQSMGSQRVRHD